MDFFYELNEASINIILIAGVVFLGLIVVLGLAKLIGGLFSLFFGKRGASQGAPVKSGQPTAAPAPVPSAQDDTELAAVIAAAVSAAMGTGPEGFRIASIKRAAPAGSAWNTAARTPLFHKSL